MNVLAPRPERNIRGKQNKTMNTKLRKRILKGTNQKAMEKCEKKKTRLKLQV